MLELNVVLFLLAVAVHMHLLPTVARWLRMPPKRQALVSLGLSALLVIEGWTGALIYRDVRDRFRDADPAAVWQALEQHRAEREAAR